MNDDVMKDRLHRASAIINDDAARQKQYKSRLHKESKEKLRKTIETKLRTTMIGAIDKMEKFMGESWGHGLQEHECTDAQLNKYDVWQQCRDEILNLGNKQIRSVLAELDLYDVAFKRREIRFTNNY